MSKHDTTLTGASDTALLPWTRGLPGVLSIAGNFGGGTVTFDWQDAAGNWTPFPEPDDEQTPLAATTNRAVPFDKLPAVQVRATLAGATNANLFFSAVP